MVTTIEVKEFINSNMYVRLLYDLNINVRDMEVSIQQLNIFSTMINNAELSVQDLEYIINNYYYEIIDYTILYLEEFSTNENVDRFYTKTILIPFLIDYYFFSKKNIDGYQKFLKKEKMPSYKKFSNKIEMLFQKHLLQIKKSD